MKMTTEYWLGANHVGDAGWHMRIVKLPAKEIIKTIAECIMNANLAKRLDFVIARTEEECKTRLEGRSNVGTGSRSAPASGSMMAELDAMLAAIGDDE